MEVTILAETLKVADSGQVECTIVSNGTHFKGIIENAFFEDFFGNQPANKGQKLQASTNNIPYFTQIAAKQLQSGQTTVVIR